MPLHIAHDDVEGETVVGVALHDVTHYVGLGHDAERHAVKGIAPVTRPPHAESAVGRHRHPAGHVDKLGEAGGELAAAAEKVVVAARGRAGGGAPVLNPPGVVIARKSRLNEGRRVGAKDGPAGEREHASLKRKARVPLSRGGVGVCAARGEVGGRSGGDGAEEIAAAVLAHGRYPRKV